MLRKVICIIFTVLLSLAHTAQNVDSLEKALGALPEAKTKLPEDTSETYILYMLSQKIHTHDKLEEYCTRLKDVAERKLQELPAGHKLRIRFGAMLAFAYNELGIINRDKGNVIVALDHLHKSIKLYEDLRMHSNTGVCYNNMALIYSDIGDLDKAIDYLKKGLRMLGTKAQKAEVAHLTGNLGYFYYLRNQPDTAFVYFHKSLELSKEVKDDYLEALAFSRIGLIYMRRLQTDKAMECYHHSLDLYEKSGDQRGIASVLNSIGDCYMEQGKPDEALQYSARSLAISRGLGNIVRIRQAALSLKDIYQKLGKDKEALAMHELYVQMHDSINNEKNRKTALRKQLEYEYARKEIILREEQEKLKKLYEQKHQFYLMIAAISVLLVMIIFYSVYLGYKFKRERESKNLHVELRERLRQEIREKESIANSIINIQEQEREKLAAELHDGVNQLLFAAKIQMQAAKNTDEEMHRDAVKLVETAIQEIRSIAGNQGSFILNNKSLKDALTDLILHMKSNQSIALTFLNYGLEESMLNATLKTNILRIIQELLNNTIRHSGAKQCYISAKTTSAKVLLAVSDTGSGMKKGLIADGNGLKNIGNKVTLMKGTKRTFSISGKGTKVFIQIPLN